MHREFIKKNVGAENENSEEQETLYKFKRDEKAA